MWQQIFKNIERSLKSKDANASIWKVNFYNFSKLLFDRHEFFLISKECFQIVIRNIMSIGQIQLSESNWKHYFKITLKLKTNHYIHKSKSLHNFTENTQGRSSGNGLCRVLLHIWCIYGCFFQMQLPSFYDWHHLFDRGRFSIIFFSQD